MTNQAGEIADTYNLCIILHEETTDALTLALAYRKHQLVDLNDPDQRNEIFGNMPVKSVREIIHTKTPLLLKTKKDK